MLPFWEREGVGVAVLLSLVLLVVNGHEFADERPRLGVSRVSVQRTET